MSERERRVIRKSQVISTSNDTEGTWIALFNLVYAYQSEGWEILHVDEQGDDLVISIAREPSVSTDSGGL